MISGQFAVCDAHAFPRAHRQCAFEIAGAQKIQPFLLDLENSAWIVMNDTQVNARSQRLLHSLHLVQEFDTGRAEHSKVNKFLNKN